MFLENQDVITAPLAAVYELIRDDVSRLSPFLVHIDRIVCVKKVELSADQLSRENHWFAKIEVPALAQKYIKPEYLGWKEKVVWDDLSHSATFTMESFVGAALFEATGTYQFRSLDDQRTEILVRCEVTLTPEKIKMIPKSIGLVARPLIEALIRRMIEPSLKNLSRCLNQYFEANVSKRD